MSKPSLFISYRRRGSSRILANEINVRLKSSVDVFLDEDDIDVGDKWKPVAERAIINSEYFLLILAPDTLESGPVQFEIATALRHDKKIIPLLTDDFSYSTAQIPLELAEIKDITGLTYDYRNPNNTFAKLEGKIGLSSDRNIQANLPRLMGGLVIVLGLLLAFLALFSEEWRNDLFYKLGVYTATPANIVIVATDTPQPPSDTPQPTTALPTSAPVATETPQPLASSTEGAYIINVQPTVRQGDQVPIIVGVNAQCDIWRAGGIKSHFTVSTGTLSFDTTNYPPGTTINILCTDTQGRSAQASFRIVGDTLPTASGQVQLRLFIDPDSLTLYVSQHVSLEGLQFTVIDNGVQKTGTLQDAFSILQLTASVADADTCFVYQLSNTSPVLSASCKGQVFKYTVALADRFWYDPVGNRQRAIAIYKGDVLLAACPEQAACDINWPVQ